MPSETLGPWELEDARGKRPAVVPGSVADALRAAGEVVPADLDGETWTFRTRFPGREGEQVTLRFGGIATRAEVVLNGERILESESMFARHDVAATLRSENELEVHCLPLAPAARQPRARWRTKVADNALRFHRTSLLGRAPGFAPGPPVVGLWRPVSIRRGEEPTLSVRTRLEGNLGVVTARAVVPTSVEKAELELDGVRVELDRAGPGSFQGRMTVANPRLWWPHTHGEPVLHDVSLLLDGLPAASRRVGFRTLGDGFPVCVNGVDVFARGAVWEPGPGDLRATLSEIADAGMNMLRVVGLSAYEDEPFHDLCDELGILVWQDFMFANFDYPIADDAFRALVEAEIRQELEVVGGRPSLVVVCGNSEIEQQVAMLGLDPDLGRGELFGELLPSLIAEAEVDAIYVPSSPSGGELPFFPRDGVANYYGVGGYRRPLEDARRADVKFAGECLAFSNVPGDEEVSELGPVQTPRWKAGVPRDRGAAWDFEDVRDFYLELLFGIDPAELRRHDEERYLELSRATTGEVMAETLGEWRRPASECGGALVLWLRDLQPGAGWGVLASDGTPKVCWHHLRRICAPIAVWTTDEGMNGIDVHVANDGGEGVDAELRVTFYSRTGRVVASDSRALALEPHSAQTLGAEGLVGRFVDAAWAYRFGPPAHEAVVATLFVGDKSVSQAFRFPAGRPAPMALDDMGLRATHSLDNGEVVVRLETDRLAYGVRVRARGWSPDDDGFSIEPGGVRTIRLRASVAAPFECTISALNLDGAVYLRGA